MRSEIIDRVLKKEFSWQYSDEKIFFEKKKLNIEILKEEDLPDNVLSFLLKKKKKLISFEEYKEKKFEKLFKITLGNKDVFYIASEYKDILEENNYKEHYIYIYEENDKWDKIWYSTIVLPFENGIPLNQSIEYNKTEMEFERNWYWERRLFIMNYLTNFFYKNNLKSSSAFNELSKWLWEKMLKKGGVEKKENENWKIIYEFKKNIENIIK